MVGYLAMASCSGFKKKISWVNELIFNMFCKFFKVPKIFYVTVAFKIKSVTKKIK